MIIELTRGRQDVSSLIGNDDVALPAIAVAELLSGIENDPELSRRTRSQQSLDRVLALVPIVDYTLTVARHHAKLLVHTRDAGHPCGAPDLIIAATARATDRTLLSTDAKADFATLPGVQARLVT